MTQEELNEHLWAAKDMVRTTQEDLKDAERSSRPDQEWISYLTTKLASREAYLEDLRTITPTKQ